MKKPMPLPVTITDYILLDQMGYEVLHKDGKPVKVVPKSKRCLTRKLKTKLPGESEHNAS